MFDYRKDVFYAVEGRCKESVVSKLAKSLFEPVPSSTPKRALLDLPEHKNLVMEQGPLSGISIHDLHKAFSSKNSGVSIGCELAVV